MDSSSCVVFPRTISDTPGFHISAAPWPIETIITDLVEIYRFGGPAALEKGAARWPGRAIDLSFRILTSVFTKHDCSSLFLHIICPSHALNQSSTRSRLPDLFALDRKGRRVFSLRHISSFLIHQFLPYCIGNSFISFYSALAIRTVVSRPSADRRFRLDLRCRQCNQAPLDRLWNSKSLCSTRISLPLE